MAINLPQKPRAGFHSIQEIVRAINGVIDYIASFSITGEKPIRVHRTMFETKIGIDLEEAKNIIQEEADKGGPFAVEIANRWNGFGQRVVLCNSDSRSGIAGVVRVGSHLETVRDMDWQPQAGVLFLDVTYDENTEKYVIEFKLEPTLPDTAIRRYILRIGEITYNSETETYSAHQARNCGDIEITDRWVK